MKVNGYNWPLAAQQVMYQAGIEPSLRTDADSQPAPAGVELTAAPGSVASGGSTTLTATVQDFSDRAVSDLAISLNVPSGWTAEQVTTPSRSLTGGMSTVVSWKVTAPTTTSGPVPTATFTAQAGYRSGPDSYTASASAGVTGS